MSSEDRKPDEDKPTKDVPPTPFKLALRPAAKIQTRREAVIEAIQTNDMDRLLFVLKEGPTLLEATGYEMVSLAASNNNFNAVRLLAEYGCPVMRPSVLPYFIPSPMSYAAEFRNAAMVRFLLTNAGKIKIKDDVEDEVVQSPSRPKSR